MSRLTTADLLLSDDLLIPKGTMIVIPAHSINMDPAIFPEPEKFDGFRFAKLRARPGNENKYQFVTTGAESVNFGHGTHACPGRFFASNEIKVLLVELLLRYDFRFQEGQGRPVDYVHETTVAPDPTVEVLFRQRVHD